MAENWKHHKESSIPEWSNLLSPASTHPFLPTNEEKVNQKGQRGSDVPEEQGGHGCSR